MGLFRANRVSERFTKEGPPDTGMSAHRESKMTLREKQAALAADLSRYKTPQDRLSHIIRIGRSAPVLDDQFKTTESKLEGCLSNLWLRSEFRDGICFFRADSDSAIVKGLATVIC